MTGGAPAGMEALSHVREVRSDLCFAGAELCEQA